MLSGILCKGLTRYGTDFAPLVELVKVHPYPQSTSIPQAQPCTVYNVTRGWLSPSYGDGRGGDIPDVGGAAWRSLKSKVSPPPPPPLPQARDIATDYRERHYTSMNLLCLLHSSLIHSPPLSSRDIPRSHSATRYPDRFDFLLCTTCPPLARLKTTRRRRPDRYGSLRLAPGTSSHQYIILSRHLHRSAVAVAQEEHALSG